MKNNSDTIDFSTILASAAHDMKNSLSMLLNSLDEVISTGNCNHCNTGNIFPQLSYQARRVHNDLVQLLSVFRLEQDNYEPSITHQSVHDFLEEQLLNSQTEFAANHVQVTLDCDPGLVGFFDSDLIAGVMNNILNNAIRYSKERICVSAKTEQDMLVISVEDDGEGYPPNMFYCGEVMPGKLNFESGNTGLGIYFSSLVAKAHRNKDRCGHICVNNDSRFAGGGKFTIALP